MLQIIVAESDSIDAVNAGGPVHVKHLTFSAECPALEEYLAEVDVASKYITSSIIGVSIEANKIKEEKDPLIMEEE